MKKLPEIVYEVNPTEAGTELLVDNIANFSNDFNLNMDGFLDLPDKVYSEEKNKTKIFKNKKIIYLYDINQANIIDNIKVKVSQKIQLKVI